MEIETIVSLVSSVGFPIVACAFMWKYINTTVKDLTGTLNENTKMIAKLCEKLETTKINDE